MMNGRTVTILGSGVALGVYIPALLVDYQLRRLGLDTEVVILESLFQPGKQLKILENKKAFHRNFRVALTGQKMAGDQAAHYEPTAVEELLRSWERGRRRQFIVFSGFWMPLVQEWKRRNPSWEFQIEIVHMDAAVSASWSNVRAEADNCHHVWLFDWQHRRLLAQIPVTAQKPTPYAQRSGRYVVHGGGWGMGTYQSTIPELAAAGLKLDIVAYDRAETEVRRENCRYFMMDPDWAPWHQSGHQRHEFPPFGEVSDGQTPVFVNRPEHHELYDLVASAKAIVSKPGGATLLDSLAAATPLVMLDPFGGYEQKNAELWERLGLGISYPRWRDSGFSELLLEDIHANLLRLRDTVPNYPEEYFRRCGQVSQALSKL